MRFTTVTLGETEITDSKTCFNWLSSFVLSCQKLLVDLQSKKGCGQAKFKKMMLCH